MENKSPLSPHIQIYRWHISSLVSITHRITGIINIIVITLICLWLSLLLFGESKYETISVLLNSSLGKFIILTIMSSFSTQAMRQIRKLAMHAAYVFEQKTKKISGLIVIVGSIIFTVLFYLIGKNFL